MNRGEFAKSELTITPAANGSYLVRRDVHASYEGMRIMRGPSDMACFSNYGDLLNFLGEEYRVANSPASIDMGQREAS